MMNENEVVKEYRTIKEEYAYDPDILFKDDERVARVKQIIDTRLSVVDKTIILLYADCQSYRKLGKKLGVSHMTIRREIIRIKNIILKEYESNRWTYIGGNDYHLCCGSIRIHRYLAEVPLCVQRQEDNWTQAILLLIMYGVVGVPCIFADVSKIDSALGGILCTPIIPLYPNGADTCYVERGDIAYH